MIAIQVWADKAAITEAEARFDKLKAQLIEVGGEGKTYEINDQGGKVQVTTASAGGPTSKFSYQFDENVFLSLPPEQRNELEKLGVVTLMRAHTKATAATVKVFGVK